VQGVVDAQLLVTGLPDGYSKGALQSALATYSLKLQVAQDELNTTIMVDNASITTNNLSTQALVDTSKLKIAEAQSLVTSLADSVVKTTLQGRVDALNAKVQVAQDVINATILVDTAGLSIADLRTQDLIDVAKQLIGDAQVAVTLLPSIDAKTLLQSRLDGLSAKVQIAQDELNAQIAVDKVIFSIGDLSTQVLIDSAKQSITEVQVTVTALLDGNVKETLQSKLDEESATIVEAQNTLNAINALEGVNTATSDMSTQTLIDDAKKAISDAQVLVDIVIEGDVKISLLANLTSASEKVVVAQSVLDQNNVAIAVVTSVTVLVDGDLSSQSLIDFANNAIKDAQIVVTALVASKTKGELQNELNTATVKVLSAQTVQNDLVAAVEGVNSTVTLSNADLSTQALIDSAKASITGSQALVALVVNSSIKTSLQAQLAEASVKVATAQSTLDAINAATNAVTSAGVLASGDLSNQDNINSTTKAINDAQLLVNVLEDSTIKTTLQNQLATYTSVVATAQTNLNALNEATTSVASVETLVTGDLSTQVLIDSANQALSSAQVLVTNLISGVAKTSLQGKLTADHVILVSAQDNLNALNIATTSVTSAGALVDGSLITQELLDAANKALIDAQLLVTGLVASSGKDTLQSTLSGYVAKMVTAQEVYTVKYSVPAKASVALDVILKSPALTFSDTSTVIASLSAQKAIIDTLPSSPTKTALVEKYNAAVAYAEKSLETLLSQKVTGKAVALSADVLDFFIGNAVTTYGSNTGKVNGFVMPLLSGRATGKQVNDLIAKYSH
jgi:hypothetical protein